VRCREGILLELVERLQAKVVTQLFPKAVTKLFPKAVTKAFLQLVLEVLPPKVIPKCATFLPGHHPAILFPLPNHPPTLLPGHHQV